MQRDILLLTEMIDAAEQAQRLVDGITVSQLEADRQRTPPRADRWRAKQQDLRHGK